MRPEANLQHPGGRSSQGFSGLLASSGSLVAPLHRWSEERRNHTRHHQPQQLIVRESGAGPDDAFYDDWLGTDTVYWDESHAWQEFRTCVPCPEVLSVRLYWPGS